MKILQHTVILESMTPEPLELIKRMGQKCWQSESKRTPEQFAKMLINKTHESVLEHASMSVSIITDRGITHEIVRHRIGCSYSQESTRYVKYDGDMEVMDQGLKDLGFDSFESAIHKIEDTYAGLIKDGNKAQVARSVLPNALKADIGMTANFKAWRHFLKLRLSPAAHPSIRKISRAIHNLLPPVITSDICIGCGNKPYEWDSCDFQDDDVCIGQQILGNDGIIAWESRFGAPPPDRLFPLCKCK